MIPSNFFKPSQISDSATNYRPDIDGLRAVAVLAVIAYHAKLKIAPGGFVGVDVFFVISGYLITKIIVAEIAEDRFSSAEFYRRRIRRIIPAYSLMVLTVLVVSSWLMLPRDFIDFGKSLVASSVFSTNFLFWHQTDYFAGNAEIKPLLHTWSLSVEEQFYFVYPLLLIAIYKFYPQKFLCLFFLLNFSIFFFSLLGAEYMLERDFSGAFFFTLFRAWELMIGALLAITPWRPAFGSTIGGTLVCAGGAMILAAIVGFSNGTRFPGISALIPCFGAALIIFAGSQPSFPKALLGSIPLVLIGKISYSLYLFHWPIFAIWRYVKTDELSLNESIIAITISFIFASLSYRFIEQPMRRPTQFKNWRGFVFAGGVSASLVFVGLTLIQLDGLPKRFAPEIISMLEVQKRSRPNCIATPSNWIEPGKSCVYGSIDAPVRFLLWGDSHAHAMSEAFGDMFSDNGSAMRFIGYTACPPVPGVVVIGGMSAGTRCTEYNAIAEAWLMSHSEIETVLLAARHAVYLEGETGAWGPAEGLGGPQIVIPPVPGFTDATLAEAYRLRFSALVERLLKAGRKVVMIYPVPEVGYDVPTTWALRYIHQGADKATFDRPRTMYQNRQKEVLPILNYVVTTHGILKLDPAELFCNSLACMTEKDGSLLYYDDDHLSTAGAYLLGRKLEKMLFPRKPKELVKSSLINFTH